MKSTLIIKNNSVFRYILKKGRYAKGKNIVVHICSQKKERNNDNLINNLGICVSKKNGNSVARNKLKRWVRESYKNEEENANYRINISKDQKADYLLRIELNSNSDPLEKGYTIFTQPNDSLIDLSNEIAQNLMQINYSEFKGLDSDHYGNFPILADSDLSTIFIEFGYVSNPSDYSQMSDIEYQKKIASAIAKAFLNKIN